MGETVGLVGASGAASPALLRCVSGGDRRRGPPDWRSPDVGYSRADRGERLQAHRRRGGVHRATHVKAAQDALARGGGGQRPTAGNLLEAAIVAANDAFEAVGGNTVERSARTCSRASASLEGGVGQAVRGAQRRTADAQKAREAALLSPAGDSRNSGITAASSSWTSPRTTSTRRPTQMARRVANLGLLRDGAPCVPRRGSAGQGRGQAGRRRCEGRGCQARQRQLRQVPRGAQAASGGGREGRVEGGGEHAAKLEQFVAKNSARARPPPRRPRAKPSSSRACSKTWRSWRS